MTQPFELTSLGQQIVSQQREDRLAAEQFWRAQEEARRTHEAQIAALQRDVAREHAEAKIMELN